MDKNGNQLMSGSENINQIATIATSNSASIFSLIASADIVGKSVIIILVITSIWSWAIIIDKIFYLRNLRKKITFFEGVFWSGQVLEQLYENIKKSIDNPMAAIFVGAMTECKRNQNIKITSQDSMLRIGHKERILQAMYLARNQAFDRLEKNLGFLAIVGSSSPFIGLFGTVWGIMHSFQSIVSAKNTTLAVVAPGIAEALFVTAVGLFAAIPAVIFYNYLTGEVNRISNKAEDFIGELNTILSRAIDEEKL